MSSTCWSWGERHINESSRRCVCVCGGGGALCSSFIYRLAMQPTRSPSDTWVNTNVPEAGGRSGACCSPRGGVRGMLLTQGGVRRPAACSPLRDLTGGCHFSLLPGGDPSLRQPTCDVTNGWILKGLGGAPPPDTWWRFGGPPPAPGGGLGALHPHPLRPRPTEHH